MSKLFASRSDLKVGQLVFTISGLTGERLREAHRDVHVDAFDLQRARLERTHAGGKELDEPLAVCAAASNERSGASVPPYPLNWWQT